MQRDLNELIAANIISPEIADRIRDYYRNKKGPSVNRLFIVFGILGSILIGLGIILIIAHNWDNLSRMTKTVLAFVPLLIGQALCFYVILRNEESITCRESVSAFVFFAVGATISLVSQIYNIPGDLGSFLMIWMFLSLPLIYVMKSSSTSLLYIIGITYYACQINYFDGYSSESYMYWILLLLCLPYYSQLCKKKPVSNFTTFHHYLLPLSVVITLGTLVKNAEELMFISYFSFFGLLYLIGNFKLFANQKPINNGYKMIGTLGTIVLLLMLSFNWFWEELMDVNYPFAEIIRSRELYVASALTLIATILFFYKNKYERLFSINPVSYLFLIFIITFIIGTTSFISVVLINIMVLAYGIFTIRDGAQQDHLGVLNFGLLVITALVICRFFDTDLSFVIRGVLFISVGFGFFITNYLMLKKRRTNE